MYVELREESFPILLKNLEHYLYFEDREDVLFLIFFITVYSILPNPFPYPPIETIETPKSSAGSPLLTIIYLEIIQE